MEVLLSVGMIVALMLLLFCGYPVAFVLIGVAFCFAALGIAAGELNFSIFGLLPLRIFGLFSLNSIYPAVAPLIFMGVALERSGLSRDMFLLASRIFGRAKSGLPIAVILLGILLAPTTGLLGPAVAMLATTALPTMIDERVDTTTAMASIAAGGTIGIIIPPAIMLFFLAELIEVPVVTMFAGVLLPAGLMVAGYMLYFGLSYRRAHAQQGQPADTRKIVSPNPLIWQIAKAILPVALVVVVLTSIAKGWATPTQSGAVGALGAFVLLFLNQGLAWRKLHDILVETAHITAMVILLIIGATTFTLIFRALDGDSVFRQGLAALGLGPWGTLFAILTIVFILGFFMDWIEIVLVTMPIFYPVIAKLEFLSHVGGPMLVQIWIAVAIALVLQTSFLTPPFGFALFFLRSSVPREIPTTAIYRAVVPLITIQLAVLAALLAVPWLATNLASRAIN